MSIPGRKNLDQTGQHYMIDKRIIRFIIKSADIKKTDIVLEIGYGKGALTSELVKKCSVIAIDKFQAQLDFDSDNLFLIQGNILEKFQDIKAQYEFNKIVANIPYNISEPLIKLLFKHHFDMAVMTLGENFSDILISKDNRVGIIADKLFKIKVLCDVPKRAFKPQPKILSRVVMIKKIPNDKLDDLGKIYRGLLFLDNKKIKNALEKIAENESSMKGLTKNILRSLIKKDFLDIVFSKKLYELNNKEFLLLDKFLRKIVG